MNELGRLGRRFGKGAGNTQDADEQANKSRSWRKNDLEIGTPSGKAHVGQRGRAGAPERCALWEKASTSKMVG